MREKCPVCDRYFLVPPFGSSESELLTIGDEPNKEDAKTGELWSGKGGDVLKAEFRRVGIQFLRVRHTTMYQHNEEHMDTRDRDWHTKQLLKEMTGKRGILILGASASEFLLGDKISNLSCVDVTDRLKLRFSKYTRDLYVAIACYNPTMATFRGSSIGEIRTAIQRFADRTEDIRRK